MSLRFTTPEELAASAGWSPRRVREIARGLGACRIIGNRMVLTDADVSVILEASKPCPKSTNVAKSGGTASPLMANGTGDLRKRLTSVSQKTSRQKTNGGTVTPLFMAQKRS